MKLLLCVLLAAGGLLGQPFVFYRGVVNVASVMSPGLPGGSLARGSMFSIYGRNLGPAAGAQVSAFPLTPTFSGVSIKLTQGSTTVDALPVYVSTGQINAIVPSNTPLGQISLRVTYNNQTSNAVQGNVVPVSFGIFAINGGGFGPGYVTNFVPNAAPPFNSLRTTLKPGQIGTVWGTGLGAAAQDNNAAEQVDVATPVEVFIGGVLAKRLYAGRSNCCSSIDQVIFETPANVPLGCYVPVVVRAGGVVSNTVTAAITADGSTCSDAGNPFAAALLNGGKSAAAVLLHARQHWESLWNTVDATDDFAWVTFRQDAGSDFAYNPLVSLPPVGTCTAVHSQGDWTLGDLPPGVGPSVKTLTGGTYSLSGGPAPVTLADDNGYFSALLASTLNLAGTALSYLTGSGTYSINGTSGTDVGAFQWSVAGLTPAAWADRATTTTLTRSSGFTVRWTGITSGDVYIAAFNVNQPGNATAGFLCRADASAGTFTVPAYVMANVPPNTDPTKPPKGLLYVGALRSSQASGTAPAGLDRLLTLFSSGDARTVVVK